MREKQFVKPKPSSKSSVLSAKKLSAKKVLHPAHIVAEPILPKKKKHSLKSQSSINDPSPKKKARRYRPGVKALREIRKYQHGTNLLLSKAPFQRVVREVVHGLTDQVTCFQSEALECLQVAAEAFVIQVFEDSVLAMIHAKRVTLMVRDIQFIRRLRGI